MPDQNVKRLTRSSVIYKVTGIVALTLAVLICIAWNLHTTVSMERTFNASESDLWKVWNDPDLIQKWWGPKGYSALIVRNDMHQGGSYLWGMKSGQDKLYWTTGTYREVDMDKKIVSTMSFADERGQAIPGSQVPAPGSWPDEITVIVEFSQSEGKSRVSVTEVGIPLIIYPMSKIGWSQQFDKIQLLLSTRDVASSQAR